MRFTAILSNVFAEVKIEVVFFLKQHNDVCMDNVMKLWQLIVCNLCFMLYNFVQFQNRAMCNAIYRFRYANVSISNTRTWMASNVVDYFADWKMQSEGRRWNADDRYGILKIRRRYCLVVVMKKSRGFLWDVWNDVMDTYSSLDTFQIMSSFSQFRTFYTVCSQSQFWLVTNERAGKLVLSKINN